MALITYFGILRQRVAGETVETTETSIRIAIAHRIRARYLSNGNHKFESLNNSAR
jgi:hypothetical protein